MKYIGLSEVLVTSSSNSRTHLSFFKSLNDCSFSFLILILIGAFNGIAFSNTRSCVPAIVGELEAFSKRNPAALQSTISRAIREMIENVFELTFMRVLLLRTMDPLTVY